MPAERWRSKSAIGIKCWPGFFTLFELDAETQARDIEGIEHHLSTDTLKTLADLTVFFQQHPEVLAQFKASRTAQPAEASKGK